MTGRSVHFPIKVKFVSSNRDQAFLSSPDMKVWLPGDDLAHLSSPQWSGLRFRRSGQAIGILAARSLFRG